MRICASILMLVSTIYSQDLNVKYKYILDLYNKFNTRANLTDISSPFFISQSPQTAIDTPNLNLEAIIDNRVKINSKWYEVGKEYDDFIDMEGCPDEDDYDDEDGYYEAWSEFESYAQEKMRSEFLDYVDSCPVDAWNEFSD